MPLTFASSYTFSCFLAVYISRIYLQTIFDANKRIFSIAGYKFFKNSIKRVLITKKKDT